MNIDFKPYWEVLVSGDLAFAGGAKGGLLILDLGTGGAGH